MVVEGIRNQAKNKRVLLLVAIVFLCLAAIAGIVIATWKSTSSPHNNRHGKTSSSFDKSVSYVIAPHNVTLEVRRQTGDVDLDSSSRGPSSLRVSLAVGASTQGLITQDLWTSEGLVAMEWPDGSSMDMRKSVDGPELSCLTVKWTVPGSETETPVDCVDISESSWFGGFEESYQYWPINKLSLPMTPFVTGDAFSERQIGDVIEPLLVSSLGIGIYVEETVPLHVSFNNHTAGHFCLRGKTNSDTVYYPNDTRRAFLTYHVCRSADIARLWKAMARLFIPKPQDIPSPALFRYPIWSTWARYKSYINQTSAIDFADEILEHQFGISQLEIDDDWTPAYGDFRFDSKKFPDAKAMISNLTSKGIPVTVWMHPFFNNDSMSFNQLSEDGYLIKDSSSDQRPAVTGWWRGHRAGILDVTNPRAVEWYLARTASLKSLYNVTSFKFDAGEVNWLPRRAYTTFKSMVTPNDYSRLFAKMAYLADTVQRRQETRVGFKTQDLPILVRMIDRDSRWSHERGLRSLIPTALTFSIMGYPFILPDMIGGNAYDPLDIDKTVLPDGELFIRWLQVTTFMPTLQFSVAPWSYGDDGAILNISRKFVLLHERYSNTILSLARRSVISGEPIVRPLWWIAPDDPECWLVDSEFLLGDGLLVAPVVTKGARSRDIYLPRGEWRHGDTYAVYTGPRWFRNFPAALDELPYFLAM